MKKSLTLLFLVGASLVYLGFRIGRAETINNYQKGSIRYGHTFVDHQSTLPYREVIVTPRGSGNPPIVLIEEKPKSSPPPIVENIEFIPPVEVSPSCPDLEPEPEDEGEFKESNPPPTPPQRPNRIII